jgi:hypothetical protein
VCSRPAFPLASFSSLGRVPLQYLGRTTYGFSTFQVAFGKPPPSLPSYLSGSSSIIAFDSLLTGREQIMSRLKKDLLKAQVQMNTIADKHHCDVQFLVNSWVYVKLQPYRQTSLSGAKYHKLYKCFYGSFLIIERIVNVAYKLSLPPSKIHDIFRCSLLKAHEGPPPSSINQLPLCPIEQHPIISPQKLD